jgi:hypothetical protein
MAIKDEEQIRGWTVDYALRLHNKEEVVTASKIIAEAKQFERYITGAPSARILRLAKDDGRK